MLHRFLRRVSKSAISQGRGRFRWPREKYLQFQGLVVPLRRCGACGKTQKQGAASITVTGEDGIVSVMAGRYATALFELALETNAIDQVKIHVVA